MAEFTKTFSWGPDTFKLDPIACRISIPPGRVIYGVYLPAKGPDGKIRPKQNARDWAKDVAVQVDTQDGLIVAIHPATLRKAASGPDEFVLKAGQR